MTDRAAVQAGSTRVSYLVAGSGPGVVLVHGSSATAERNWGALIGRLSDRWRMVAPDLPGSGETRDAGGRLEIEALADCVEAPAADAKLDAYDLVGYSLGAVVAATLAARRPQRVRSLVLVAGWARSTGREKFLFDLWRRLFETDRELLARYYILTGFSPAFYAAAGHELLETAVRMTVLPDGAPRHFEVDGRVDIRALLPAIKAPTLVVGLRDDAYLPLRHSHALHASIPGAEYLELEGGHLLPFEDPVRLGDAIEPFLARQRP